MTRRHVAHDMLASSWNSRGTQRSQPTVVSLTLWRARLFPSTSEKPVIVSILARIFSSSRSTRSSDMSAMASLQRLHELGCAYELRLEAGVGQHSGKMPPECETFFIENATCALWKPRKDQRRNNTLNTTMLRSSRRVVPGEGWDDRYSSFGDISCMSLAWRIRTDGLGR